MDSRKPLTAWELEIDCGAFGKIRRASPPAKGDFAIKDGRLTLLGCIQRGLVTLSREELLPFLDAMDAQDAQIQTLNERIIELDLEAMEKCRRIDSLLTPPSDAAVREAVEDDKLNRAITQTEAALRPVEQAYEDNPSQGVFWFQANIWHIRTILRAVQAPRLTGEQMEAVQVAASLLKGKNGDRAWARRKLESAFPEAFAVGAVAPSERSFWTCGICGEKRPDCVKPVQDEECGDACPEHYEAGEVQNAR